MVMQEQDSPRTKRLVYRPPRLDDFGRLSQVIRGNASGGNDAITQAPDTNHPPG